MKIAPLFLLLLSTMILAQTKSPGTAQTKGACSPANTGNITTFTFTCGIGQEQGKQMLKILNKILSDQLDPDAVMAKLEEILSNQRKQAESIIQIQSRSWKRLSDSEIKCAADALAAFHGQKVVTTVINQDGDRMAVAKQLADILTAAQWDWQGIDTPMAWGDPKAINLPHGIQLHVGQVSKAAEALANVLTALYGARIFPPGF